MTITGKNAVREALASGQKIERMIVMAGNRDAVITQLTAQANAAGIRVDYLERGAWQKKFGKSNAQGIVAQTEAYAYVEVEDILAESQRKNTPPFLLLLDGVQDPQNLGSIIRTAECAGVDGIIIPEHRAAEVNETVIRVSAGSAAHMKIARVTNLNRTIEELKEKGIFVAAAEAGGDSIYDSNLCGAMAFVIGSEGKGIHRLTLEKCDFVISLPLQGKVNSLNASVAAGVILYEALRQRTR